MSDDEAVAAEPVPAVAVENDFAKPAEPVAFDPDPEVQLPTGAVTEEGEIDEEYDDEFEIEEDAAELPEQIEPEDVPNGGE